MNRKMIGWMIGAAVLTIAACQDATQSQDGKPSVDPDSGLNGKADGLSNRWTTTVGELSMNDVVFGEIDYPDYFHGYTVDLTEGQTVQFTLWTDAGGLFRLYGPGNGGSYGRAAVRSHTERRDGRQNGEFDFTAEQSGTYLVIYGPDWVWNSSYELSSKCLVGCDETASIRVADILADPEAYDGKRVRITGDVAAGPAICTLLACGPSNPCCNSCGASQGLYDPGSDPMGDSLGLRQQGSELHCGGNECTVADNCSVESGRYEIVGVVTAERFQPFLDIERIDRVTQSCADDSECGDGWCRIDDWASRTKVCVPWAPEGGHCGGFVPGNLAERCAPEMACVMRPFVADAPGTCRNVATVSQVMANPTDYAGKRLSITGFINTTAAICTRLACGPQNPCCNSCGASQMLGDERTDITLEGGLNLIDDQGQAYRCGGNECTVNDNCTSDETGQVRVLGTITLGEFGLVDLHVEALEPLEHL